MQPETIDDHLADIANAAARGKVKDWSHQGNGGRLGEIRFLVVQVGGSIWRGHPTRSQIDLWFMGSNSARDRFIGSIQAHHSSPKGRLIARIQELGQAGISEELGKKVHEASRGKDSPVVE